MDTDNAVVKARQEVGAEWRGTKGRKGETSVMSTVIKRYNHERKLQFNIADEYRC